MPADSGSRGAGHAKLFPNPDDFPIIMVIFPDVKEAHERRMIKIGFHSQELLMR